MKTALLAMVLLTGCASLPQGVEMTEDERAACAAATARTQGEVLLLPPNTRYLLPVRS